MQGLFPGALCLVLISTLVQADGSAPLPNTYHGNIHWRPDKTTSAKDKSPPSQSNRPNAYYNNYQPPYAYQGQGGRYPAGQTSQTYQGSQAGMATPQPAPYQYQYDTQEPYGQDYNGYPPPYHGGYEPNQTAPAYPSGYYETPGYPYQYQTEPDYGSYDRPQGYSQPPGYGYGGEYYPPSQPAPAPGYQTAPNQGYDAGYGYGSAQPPIQNSGQNNDSRQHPPAGYDPQSAPNEANQNSYAPVYPYSGGAPETASPMEGSANNQWRPTQQETPTATAHQQPNQYQPDMLINGAPAVFRPWTDPGIEDKTPVESK